MRDSMKMTVKYQFAIIILTHLAAAGVAFVFGTVAFWYFLSRPVWKEVLSIAFMAVYFIMFYIKAKRFAVLDNKPYTPLKPNKIKGVLFGVSVAAVTFVLFAIFRFVWIRYAVDGGVVGVVPTAINVIFYFWSFPFNGIMNLTEGTMTSYSLIIMLIVPIVSCALGYIAGSKNIEIMEKLDEYMYEKE